MLLSFAALIRKCSYWVLFVSWHASTVTGLVSRFQDQDPDQARGGKVQAGRDEDGADVDGQGTGGLRRMLSRNVRNERRYRRFGR